MNYVEFGIIYLNYIRFLYCYFFKYYALFWKLFIEFRDSAEVIYYLNRSLNPKKYENIYQDFDKRM